ncbi:MAG: glycosyltransferase [Bacteroidaceae bacterium]|nr:glycosyltransferase [Bacteroidaceae bacterium]
MSLTTTSVFLIIASIAIVILLPLCSAYFRKLRRVREYNGTDGIKMPSISVIISAFDNPERVLMKLSSFLNQQYESDYEVILVVDNEKIHEESYQFQLSQLPNKERLRTTYVPDSSHYMGLQKLAVTLGVKAARYNWIMLTDGHVEPKSYNWLNVMARNCFGKDIVLGYTTIAKEKFTVGSFKNAVNAREQRHADFQRFERHLWQLYNLRQAEQGLAYSTAGGNLMFRKSMFMNGKGYSGNLKYTFGEYEFLVNTYALQDNVAVETHPDSWCARDKYTAHEFDLFHRCFHETRKHLQRKWKHRMLVALDQMVLHLSFPIAILMAVYAFYTSQWIAATASFLSLPIGLFIREWLAKKSLKRFRVELKAKFITHFELYLLWQHFIYKIKYMISDKTEFISHKY